ncbi:hypothetical protein BDN72DRAFT_848447 [Pluteus cervinus]|uniref:Uncharacterized protein n=1 Tax=Pluteus cervinus TaxID=181527 RepID=A0ACD3ACQ9_9AGAR|nr:hypothetical protein BDN72DRAFT_848447 [Pluteus cervinus]
MTLSDFPPNLPRKDQIERHAYMLLHYHSISTTTIATLQKSAGLGANYETEAVYRYALEKTRNLAPSASIVEQLETLDDQANMGPEGDEDLFIKAMAASSAFALYQINRVPQDLLQDVMISYSKLQYSYHAEAITTGSYSSDGYSGGSPPTASIDTSSLSAGPKGELTPDDVDNLFKGLLDLSSPLYTQTYNMKNDLADEKDEGDGRVDYSVKGVRTFPDGLEFMVHYLDHHADPVVAALPMTVKELRRRLLNSRVVAQTQM